MRAPGLVQQLRMIKDAAEIAALRTACAIADAALAELIDARWAARRAAPNARSRSTWSSACAAHGAAGPSFETIVAAGPHSAIPHHSPTPTALRRGDFVKLDFGALVDGYHSDMTRTVVLGVAADWQRELYALVAAAQAAGRAALAPGATWPTSTRRPGGSSIDAGSRRAVRARRSGTASGCRSTRLRGWAPPAPVRLAAGMAVTVEPGVYLAGPRRRADRGHARRHRRCARGAHPLPQGLREI